MRAFASILSFEHSARVDARWVAIVAGATVDVFSLPQYVGRAAR